MNRKVIKLLMLVLVSIGINYFTPEIFGSLFFAGLLVVYFRSKDEPFWLAYFLIISDGFFGFFGFNEVLLTAIPGLPAIEAGQFYILLTVVKALRSRPAGSFFFSPHLQAMGIYVIFLVLQSYTIGIAPTMNAQFRLVKFVLPLALFFSLPRLLRTQEEYREVFTYLFPVAFTILAAQMFTIVTSVSPGQYFNATDRYDFGKEVDEYNTYRGLYSSNILLLTTFGALFYLIRKDETLSSRLLTLVIIANFLSVFLSATRGWIISLGLILFLYYTFIAKLSPRMVAGFSLAAAVLIAGILTIPIVKTQFTNAQERMLTLESLAEGDLSAEGTLSRLNERGPQVMKKWRESPLTGFGFADEFFLHWDGHVGNQNLLLHSGIVGALLMALFFAFFCSKIFFLSRRLSKQNPFRAALLVFLVFFIGWFALHSSSRQFFSYYQPVRTGILIAVFFLLGGQTYRDAKAWEREADEEMDEAEPAEPTAGMLASHSGPR